MLDRHHLTLPKFSVSLVALLAFAGCEAVTVPTLPAGLSAGEVALFKSAVENAGCTISTPAQAQVIEAQTGFDDVKLRSITQYLTLAGESEPAATGFRLTSGQCANA